MPLSIKDPVTEKFARELADIAGESLTLAIRKAVEERLERMRHDRARRDLAAELMAIGAHCAALPDLHSRTAEEIAGYDEYGLPR